MSVLTFEELTHRLDFELQRLLFGDNYPGRDRLHYTEGSIKAYRRAWKHIASYFEQEGLDGFTEEAGMRYLDSRYDFSTREAAGTLTQSLARQQPTYRTYAGRFSTAWQCIASILQAEDCIHQRAFQSVASTQRALRGGTLIRYFFFTGCSLALAKSVLSTGVVCSTLVGFAITLISVTLTLTPTVSGAVRVAIDLPTITRTADEDLTLATGA